MKPSCFCLCFCVCVCVACSLGHGPLHLNLAGAKTFYDVDRIQNLGASQSRGRIYYKPTVCPLAASPGGINNGNGVNGSGSSGGGGSNRRASVGPLSGGRAVSPSNANAVRSAQNRTGTPSLSDSSAALIVPDAPPPPVDITTTCKSSMFRSGSSRFPLEKHPMIDYSYLRPAGAATSAMLRMGQRSPLSNARKPTAITPLKLLRSSQETRGFTVARCGQRPPVLERSASAHGRSASELD